MAASRRLAAILAADVAGYSRLVGEDEEGTLDRLKAHRRELLDPKIEQHRGRIVKTTGDGVLAEFPSVVDAVRCAAEVQRGMLDRNAQTDKDRRIELRIGINLGDVVVDGGDILGDGVNIAARLEGMADPGGVCLSRTVRDQIRDRLPYPLEDLGELSVHNIARPVRAYALRREDIALLPPPSAPEAPRSARPRRRGIALAGVAAMLAVATLAWLLWPVERRGGAPGLSAAGSSDPASAGPAALLPNTAPRLSVIVLPFANLSADADQEYLADGITEDLTTDLSRVEDSFVIARNTAFTYKGRQVEARQIGRELGVRYVVDGSVRRAGNQVRINVQLVDTESGAQLWAERFDRVADELLGLESEITGQIARSVRSRMVQAEAGRPTDQPVALDYILRGRAALTKPVSKAASDEAIGFFEQALTLDAAAVRAHIGLASALVSRVLDEFSTSPTADLNRAEQLLERALEKAPGSAWAHYVKGQLLRAQWRCADAIPEYEAAIGLDRNSAPAYAWLGWCKFLTGDIERTIALEQQAIRLSPQDRSLAAWQGRIGMIHLLQGRAKDAIVWLERARSAYALRSGDPVYVHSWLASAYALTGDREQARAELDEAWKRGFHRSMVSLAADRWYANPKTRALAEASYFVGLRRAGLPDE